MFRRALATALLVFASSAVAFDGSDTGVYQALDNEGELTEKIFRFVQKREGWRVEDRQEDGSWLDVTCQGGCPLKEATRREIETFFKARTPPDVTNRCLRNRDFAFCRIERAVRGRTEIGHALVVIINGESFPIRLRALPNGPAPDDGDDGDEDDDDGNGQQPSMPPLQSTESI